MSEQRPITLSLYNVQDLKQQGRAQLVRPLKPQPAIGEEPTAPYQVGEKLWGRESVAKHQGSFLYEADGRQPGYFYLKNYYMPREACRFELEVTGERLEELDGQWVAIINVLHLVPAAPAKQAIYLLDFDQVAEAGLRTKHRPTFPVANLEHATKLSWRYSDVVKQSARFHHNAWYLPLIDSSVRDWLKEIQFTQAPTVQVGGVEVSCGKEVPI